MTHFIEGSTVLHLVGHLDHKRDTGTSVCGEDGELVEEDVDDVEHEDLCRRCRQQSPHFTVEDDSDDEEDAEDD